MKRIAVYAGTFRPFHNGHLGVIENAAKLFDEVIVGIGVNPEKELSDVDWRVPIERVLDKERLNSTVHVLKYHGLTVNFAEKKNAKFLVRAMRAVSDFDYEIQTALMNRKLNKNIMTVFVPAPLRYLYLSSTVIRGVFKSGKPDDIRGLVPDPVFDFIMNECGGIIP